MIKTSNKRETFEDSGLIMAETMDRQSREKPKH